MLGMRAKTILLPSIGIFAILAMMVPSMPFASADDTTCTDFLPAGEYDGNVIAAGPSCFIGLGTTIHGDVKHTGGDLIIDGATVFGNVQSEGGAFLFVLSSTVYGDIQVKDMSGPFPSITIDGNTIDGRVQIEASTVDFIEVGFPGAGNVINGDIQIFNNFVAFSTVISGNTVGGNIQCKANFDPAPINFGFPNDVSGNTGDERDEFSFFDGF